MFRKLVSLMLIICMLGSMLAFAEEAPSKSAVVPEETETAEEKEEAAEAEATEEEAPAEEPEEQLAGTEEQPAEESEEQPTEEPEEQPTEGPEEQPTEEPEEQPTEGPEEQPAEEPVEQPAEEPTEQPAEEPEEQPAEEPAEQPSEGPAEQPTEGTEEEVVSGEAEEEVANDEETCDHYWKSTGDGTNEWKCYYCDAINTCEHSNWTENYSYDLYDNENSVDNKDGTHTVIVTPVTCFSCADCGLNYAYWYGESKAESEEHIWASDGTNKWICEYCDAANTCTHSNWEVEYISTDYDYDSAVDCEDGTHKLTVTPYKCFSCEECGLSWENWYDESTTEIEKHSWSDEGDTCYICGASNTCTHQNVVKNFWYTKSESDPTDNEDGTHSYTARDVYNCECSDCGYSYVEDADTTYTITEKHCWSSAGTCYDCGAENTCKHENAEKEYSYTTTEGRAVDNEDGTHSYTVRDVYKLECPDCGASYTEEADKTYTKTEKHSWNDEGICYDCGAENTCKHENAKYISLGTKYESNAVDNEDGTHSYTMRNVYGYKCPDCGYSYDVYADTTYTKTEKHSWKSDGTCYDCGAENTCKHENVVKYYSYTETVGEAVDNGNGTHSCTARDIYSCECSDCGISYEEKADTYTETETHSWDDDGTCYGCGVKNTCKHENAETYSTSTKRESDPIDNKDGTHSYTARDTYSYECLDCGFVYYKVADTTYTKTEKHSWNDDGICRDCGAENTCKHENAKKVYISSSRLSNPVDNGDGTHSYTARDVYSYTCPDCGYTYRAKEDTTYTKTEKHIWNSGGICRICLTLNTCKHENAEIFNSYTSRGEAVDNGDGTHSYTAFYVTNWKCPDCGYSYTEKDAAPAKTEKHNWSWSGSYCGDCGVVNTCKHENAYKDYSYTSRQSGAVDNGNGTHSYTAYDNYDCKCPDCGASYSERSDTYTKTVKHYWTSTGKFCYYCGAEITCKHENAIKGDTYQAREDQDYVDNGDGTHSYTVYYETEYFCPDCEYSYDVYADTTYTKTEEHSWNDDGTCYCCGAENTCKHENAKVSWLRTYHKNYYYVDNGDGTHSYTAYDVIVYFCPDCGYSYDEASDTTYKKIEKHSWDDDGICYNCGAENTCKHENIAYDHTETAYESAPVDNGDGTHSYTARDVIVYYCPDCGDSFEEVSGTTYTKTEKHDWHGGGDCHFCYRCDAVNTCKHETATIEAWFESDLPVSYTSRSHTLSGYYSYEKYCAACGKHLGETDDTERKQKTEAHNFENGVCRDCGYSYECKHTLTKQYITTSDARCVAMDGLEAHGMQSTINVCTYCAFCGETISTETYKSDISRVEPHSYDSNGICYECGHINTCKHLHTSTSTGSYEEGECTAVDATYHTSKVCTYSRTVCKDCGQWFSDIADMKETTEKSEHNFVNGICTGCGYDNNCQHTKTETRDSYNSVVLNVTAKQHTVLIQPVIQTVCSSCGEVLSSKLNGSAKEETENHSFCASDYCNYCTGCGYAYDGTSEVTCNHKPEKVAGREATCTEEGLTEGEKCSVCGEILTAQQTIPKKAHTPVTLAGKAATCTEEGLSEGSKCSVCDTTITAQTKIPAKGHTLVKIAGKAATCTEAGLTEGKKCSVCGKITTAQTKIPAKGHTEKTIAAVAATSVTAGKTAYTICSVCKTQLTKPTTIKALGIYPKTIKLAVGETYKPTIVGKEKKTYTTSSKKVATVSTKGVIKGVKTGTAKVTVTATNGYKQTVKVTVVKAATKVKLNKATATISKGKTLKLKATVTGYSSKLTWTSSNKKVATVDENGKVTAVKKGTATITVKTFNGKKATCKITVK